MLVEKKKTGAIKDLKSKAGKSFEAALRLSNDFKVEFVFLNAKK